MSEYVITLLAAAAVTYILTPAVRRFAIAVGAMHAARERDVHELPTPLLGGFAIYGGLAAALLLASRLSGLTSVFTETNMAKGLLLAGALVVIMGFVDDRWGMGALSKLAGQVAAGVILVWSGAEIPWLPAPGGVTIVLTSNQQVAVTILVVVVTMNAVNFIDGLDGLAAGIVGIGAIAFFAYYFTLVHRLGLLDQSEPALVSVLLAGVCIGFLPHNFHPARIFMGDTGSMLIGLMLAYAPISSLALLDPASLTDNAAYQAGTVNRYGAFIPLLVPAAILLIPYADLLMAVVRRTRAGKSVFAPDKKHLQHRLLAIGHSHRTSVLIMYLWAALFSGTVILLSIVRTPLFVLAIVTVVAVLLLLLVTMPRLRPWSRATAGYGVAGSQGLRPASPAPAGAAPASAAGTAATVSGPVRQARADAGPAPEAARGGAARAGTVPAGPPAAAQGTAGVEPVRPAEPVRSAGAGAVQVPETARGNAARAAIRARLAESAKGNGVTGNGGAPGKGAAGNGTSGNGSAPASGVPAEGRGREDYAAGSDTPAVTPEDEAGSPVTRAAGPSGWSWDAADTLPPRSGDQAVPPWEADDAGPARPAPVRGGGRDAASPDGPYAVPPWAAESRTAAPEPASPIPSWDAGSTAPPAGISSLAAGRSVPPWELPPEAHSAVPPWVAGHAVPPWAGDGAAPSAADHVVPPWAGDGAAPSAAGRSVPPWELPDPDATGPVPVLPWPGQGGTPAVASDRPGNGPAGPPWPPAAAPRSPAAPPWPPAVPPRPPASPPWP
jgi:UDP-GlcNAc:undecaprenyl-phosphate GlcNAc-1-phosphate transferase